MTQGDWFSGVRAATQNLTRFAPATVPAPRPRPVPQPRDRPRDPDLDLDRSCPPVLG